LTRGDILLCDLDAFYASVEQRDEPSYRGRPVIVGGRPNQRGVVSACSYEARAFGVRSAMPLITAARLCPHAVFLPVNMDKYRRVSEEVFHLLYRQTPWVEPVSVDEAYLQVGDGEGMEVAQRLKNQIRQQVGLAISVGISHNKLLAKIACDLGKPDGLYRIPAEGARKVLAGLPVCVLPGVGPSTAGRLQAMGIVTVGQLQMLPVSLLEGHFGSRGRELALFAVGEDSRPLVQEHQVKSVGEEITFPLDISHPGDIPPVLLWLSEEVGYRMRRLGKAARTLTVKMRSSDFTTRTRSVTPAQVLASDREIYHTALDLYEKFHQVEPVRLVGVQVSNLVDKGFYQMALWEESHHHVYQARLAEVQDRLREKYGKPVIKLAGGLDPNRFRQEKGRYDKK